jgi:dsRNA-specific ribonuclease
LSTSKAAIVNNLVLSRVCREVLNIHEHILVGVDFDLAIGSKTQSYIKGRQTIEAGAIESIIGAIYLDKVCNVHV